MTTSGWLSKLSDTKKGILAIIGALVVGASIGSIAVTQVGIPQRVDLLEADHILLRERVTAIEVSGEAARVEREYIINVLSWTTCAIEADADDIDIRSRCGSAPLWRGE
jgi:hypothetical protein